jgi:hypothetical protein
MAIQSGYLLDGLDLAAEYEIYIGKATGFWDIPKRKNDTEYSWGDEDGVEAFTDEDDIYIDARNLTLICHIVAESKEIFLKNMNAFKTKITSPGLHTIKLPYGSMVYSVYLKDNMSFNILTKWLGNKLVGKFIINLREPQPVVVSTYVFVTSPNGAELLEAGTNHNIKWNSDGVDNIKIEYSDDNGISWRVIEYETISDGSYSWLVPYIDSGNCLVKITDNNGYDISDSVFTIYIAYSGFIDSESNQIIDSDGLLIQVRK